MARRPNIRGDKDSWGEVLNAHLDVSLDEEGQLRESAVASVAPVQPYDALDIWDAFDATGQTSSGWSASTYANWLSGVDALFTTAVGDGRASRSVLGADDFGNDIVQYTAGPANAPTAMLISGIHGEWLAQRATMRFFESFVYSSHPMLHQLRKQLRLVWIVTVTPSGYPGNRRNGNGIDINRNFDFWWDLYPDDNPDTPKGDAPFDQPEAQAVRDAVLVEKPGIFIDCHNYGNASGPEVAYGATSPYVFAARQFVVDAMSVWNGTYNADNSVGLARLNDTNRNPVSKEWAAYAMRWVNGDMRTATMTLEASQNSYGSTIDLASRPAIRMYASALLTMLQQWAERSATIHLQPYPYAMAAFRDVQTPPTSITTGGTLIDSANFTPAPLTFAYGSPVPFASEKSLAVPTIYAPATVIVEASGSLRSSSPAPNPGRIYVSIYQDGSRIPNSLEIIHVPAVESVDIPFYTSALVRVDSVSVGSPPVFELVFERQGQAAGTTVRRARVIAQVFPHTEDARSFRLGGI